MKIVYSIHSTCNSGGMERVLANKVNYLANLPDYEVLIITTGQRGRPHFYEISTKVKCIDLEINYSEASDENAIVRMINSSVKYFKHKRLLKKVLFELKSDVVVSMFTNDVSFLHKIKDGSKKVLEIHFCRQYRLLTNRKGIVRLLDHLIILMNDRLVTKYDKFVVLTNQDKQNWKRQKNISVIYNSISNSTDTVVSSLDNKNVISIGRLSYQKNVELLVELWAEINKRSPNWTLTIVGVGNSKELKYRIVDRSLENVINIVPSTQKIGDYYRNSSIYLMTSRYEGLPMVLIEAQKYGLPIVSFDCKCGPREIIENEESGFLIENGNVVNFIEKVSLLIENENLRKNFGKKAKINSFKFSENIIMQQWVELFEELVN